MSSQQSSVTSEDSPQSSDLSPQENSSQSSDLSGQGEKVNPQKDSEAVKTPSSLRDSPPSPGERLDTPKLEASATMKTQGVRVSRGGSATVLQGAAGRASRSGSRNDVHEYMRLRRGYV